MPQRRKSVRRDLRISIIDGSFWSFMTAFGERYFGAFALAVGLGQVASGWVAMLPVLGGALIQLLSPLLIRVTGTLRRAVLVGCGVQALSFAPLVYAAYHGRISLPMMLIVASIFWGGGLIAAPPWNTWMGQIVPRRIRARYFATRSRTMQVCVCIGLLLAVVVRDQFGQDHAPLWGYVIMFSVAGVCRAVSTSLLAAQREPPPLVRSAAPARWWEALNLRSRVGGVLLFVFIFQFAFQIAQPYLTPYLMHHLRFGHAPFATVLAAEFLGRVIALQWVGRLAERHGAAWLLLVGLVVLTPLPLLWLVSGAVPWIVSLQLVAGGALACYEIGIFLMLLEVVPDEQRPTVVTIYQLIWACGAAAGTLLGGEVLRSLGAGWGGYAAVFGAALVLRAGAVAYLWRFRRRHAGA